MWFRRLKHDSILHRDAIRSGDREFSHCCRSPAADHARTRLERGSRASVQHMCAQSIHMDKGRAYNLWQPRSHCPACGHTLRLLENIPLVSYLRLRGRCAACCAPIPIRYLLIELLSAISAASAFWRFGASGQALAAYGLVAALLALAW